MSVFIDLSAALDGRLNSMASLPPVAWENKKYDPVKGTLYLRPTLLPGDTVGGTLSATGSDENVGVYIVDVFSPADGGKNEAVTMADNIADQFKPVTELTYNGRLVRCISVSRGSAIVGDGWYNIPVRVRYHSFTDKR